jgi:hypothetical protein
MFPFLRHYSRQTILKMTNMMPTQELHSVMDEGATGVDPETKNLCAETSFIF